MAKNSAIGPSPRAGKKVSAPTTRMVPNQKLPNFKVSVRSVPTVGGKVGLAATDPATAIMKMIGG